MTSHTRPVIVYSLMVVLGAAAFLYPFWIPSASLPNTAHAGDAPLVAAVVGGLVVVTMALEVRRGTMNGATIAILGVLAATTGLVRPASASTSIVAAAAPVRSASMCGQVW